MPSKAYADDLSAAGASYQTADEQPTTGNASAIPVPSEAQTGTVTAEPSDVADDKYHIFVASSEGGTVETDKTEAAAGEIVTLKATPENEDYSFHSFQVWSSVSGQARTPVTVGEDGTFTMPPADVIVAAKFAEKEFEGYRISSQDGAGGSLDFNPTANYWIGWDEEEGGDVLEVSEGVDVVVVAKPDPGYKVTSVRYTYALGGKTETETVEMSGNEGAFKMPAADVTVQAEFAQKAHAIIISDMQNGTIASDDIRADANGGVVLTAVPEPGYKVTSVEYSYTLGGKTETETVEMSGNEGAFKMPAADVTVTAAFVQKEHAVVVPDGVQNGTIAPNDTRADAGDRVELTACPDSGYKVTSVEYSYTLDGQDKTETVEMSGNEGAFKMPAADVTVTATFTQKAHEVALVVKGSAEGASIRLTDDHADSGDEVGIIVSCKAGYRVESVTYTRESAEEPKKAIYKSGDSEYEDDGWEYTFTMPNEKVTVNVVIDLYSYEVKVRSADHGTFSVAARTFDEDGRFATVGTPITVVPVPDPGYAVSAVYFENYWEEGDEYPVSKNASGEYVFTMPASEVTVCVVFGKASSASDEKGDETNNANNADNANNANNNGNTDATSELNMGETASNVKAGSATVEVKATASGEVEVTSVSASSGGSVSINTVTVNGKTYKVTSVADGALQGSAVKSVTVGNNVTSIGKRAFQNTKSLTNLTVGKNVKKIGANALKGSKLKKVTLKTSKLNKSNFRHLLKGSKVQTVKLTGVGKKAKNHYKEWAKSLGIKVK